MEEAKLYVDWTAILKDALKSQFSYIHPQRKERNNKAIERDKLLILTLLLLPWTKILINHSNDFDLYEKYLSS